MSKHFPTADEQALRQSRIADRVASQIEYQLIWDSGLAQELDETFSCDSMQMYSLLNAVRKTLNNATRAQGIDELADLLDPIRQREAERFVDTNWDRLTEVERVGDE